MELRSAQLFAHLATTLNYSKTAEQLFVSPSTLTRVVQRLEEELKVQLFSRDKRSVRLTPAGERFLVFVRRYLHDWQQLQQDLSQNAQTLQGELRLFCTVTASYSHLPAILDKFRVLCPLVEIKLSTGDAALALEKVKQDECDIALAVYPPHLPLNIAFTSIASLPLYLIAPMHSAALQGLLQPPIDWDQVPFILPEHGPARSRLEQWFSQAAISPNVVAKVEGHEAMVSMVALGTGVAIAAEPVLQHSPVRDRVRILDVGYTFEPFELGLCVQSKRLHEPLIRSFWQLAAERTMPLTARSQD